MIIEKEKQLFAEAVVMAQNQLAVNNMAGRTEKYPVIAVSRLVFMDGFTFLPQGQTWLTNENSRSTILTLLLGCMMQELNAMPREQYHIREPDHTTQHY